MFTHPYNEDTRIATGGSAVHVFASIACVGSNPRGENKSGAFYYGADTAGYCLDAPSWLPAGSSRYNELACEPETVLAYR